MRRLAAVSFIAPLVVAASLAEESRAQGTTVRVSVDSQGNQADNSSIYPVMSSNLRFIAYESYASNLVAGDANGLGDIFVLDRDTAAVERVSVSFSGGDSIGGNSGSPAISADGRFVAFDGDASNLVPNDANGTTDVFVRDRLTGTTERVSVDLSGGDADGGSSAPAISPDGRFVAFTSSADDLVAGDTNHKDDTFVRDRQTGITELVSINSAGKQGNDQSVYWPSISADGRYVAFLSLASNLVAGDTNRSEDIFVRDRSTGTTERVSVSSAGVQGNYGAFVFRSYLSADGRFVAFYDASDNLVAGDVNATGDAFVHDRQTGTTQLISVDSTGLQGDGTSFAPSISADGRFVAFESFADNLVSGDANGAVDVFVHDRVAGTTERASVDSTGIEGNNRSDGPALSDDGEFVTYSSNASNLIYGDTNGVNDIFLRDRSPAGDTVCVSVDSSGIQGDQDSSVPAVSANGQVEAFQSDASNLVINDTNGVGDVFVRDRITGTTERVSIDSTGAAGNGPSSGAGISADGQIVAFESLADNLVAGDANGVRDVFDHDRSTALTERVSVDSSGVEGNGASYGASLAADGRFCAFASSATNLVASDTNGVDDVFVHDRVAGTTERVSVDSAGKQANGASFEPAISADGQIVAFTSTATNLVGGAGTGTKEIYVHDRTTGATELVSVDSAGVPANGDSQGGAISTDGRFVVFESAASNLVAGDTNGATDIFVHDRVTGTTERASLDSMGTQANGSSSGASISANGRFVTFASLAANLVAGDTNGVSDVFTRDRTSGLTRRESVDSTGAEGNGESGVARTVISADGSFVAFDSRAANLAGGDTNDRRDVFVRDRRSVLATWWNYGAGFPGTNGVPSLAPRSDPVIGSTLTLDVGNSSGTYTFGMLFIGYEQAAIHSGWGGTLVVSPSVALVIGLTPLGASFTGDLPGDPALRGFLIDLQAIEGDAGAARGIAFTQGLELVLGK